ncbi:MAG: hypothetical protein K2L01_06985 [Rikenellaceae bacterium]|nr:hypothetical protein [Rikenellaceae bacterium]
MTPMRAIPIAIIHVRGQANRERLRPFCTAVHIDLAVAMSVTAVAKDPNAIDNMVRGVFPSRNLAIQPPKKSIAPTTTSPTIEKTFSNTTAIALIVDVTVSLFCSNQDTTSSKAPLITLKTGSNDDCIDL